MDLVIVKPKIIQNIRGKNKIIAIFFLSKIMKLKSIGIVQCIVKYKVTYKIWAKTR